MVIGGSWRLFRRDPQSRDTRRGRHQRAKPRTSSLGNLPVLLGAPPMESTEVLACTLCGLPAEHQALILRQLAETLPDPPQLVASDRRTFGLGARIWQIQRLIRATERNRRLQCGRHRAATGYRPAAILDPGEETLLQGVPDMRPASESTSASSENHQLQRGLSVAVLQILAAQPVAVDPQQQLPLRGGDHRHRFSGIAPPAGARLQRLCKTRRSLSSGKSGRHTRMSSPVPLRPPLQLR
jgi:hypothetical protein